MHSWQMLENGFNWDLDCGWDFSGARVDLFLHHSRERSPRLDAPQGVLPGRKPGVLGFKEWT